MALKVGDLLAVLRLDKSQYSRGLKEGDQQATKFSKATGATFNAWAQVIKAAMVAAAAAFTGTIVAATKFQKQLSNVATMVDDTEKFMGQFRTGLIQTARDFGQSTKTLSDGLYDILSASIPADRAMEVLRVSATAASAGMTETGVAADALTSLINSFGASADDAGFFSDLLFTIVKKGKTTFDELAPAIGRVASLSAAAGVSAQEMGASLSVMTRAGLNTNEAVTALRGLITSLLKPSDEAVQVAKDLGIEWGSQALEAEGLEGVMKNLAGLPADVLARLVPNVRGMTAAVTAAADLGTEIEDFNILLSEGSPTLEAFEKATANFDFTFRQFKQTMVTGAAVIGEAFLPGLNTLFAAINEWVGGPAQTGFQDFIMGIGKGFQEAITAIVNFINNADPLFQWLGRVFGPIGEQVNEFFNIVREAFTEIVGIFFGSAEDSEKAFTAIQYALRGVGLAFQVLLEIVKFSIGTQLNYFKSLVQTVKDAAGMMWNFFTGNWEVAREQAANIKDVWRDFGEDTAQGFRDAVGGVQQAWVNVKDAGMTSLGEINTALSQSEEKTTSLGDATVASFERSTEAYEAFRGARAEGAEEEDEATRERLAQAEAARIREEELQEEANRKREQEVRDIFRRAEEELKAARNKEEQMAALREEFRELQLTEEELELERIEERRDKFIEAGVDRTAAEKWATDEITRLNKEAADTVGEKWQEVWDNIHTIASMTLGSLTAIGQQYFTNQQAALDNRELSEEELARKQAELEQRQFKFQKATNIAQAIMNTAEAVTRALTVPVGGRILAAVVGALGTAQVALITAQQPPPMPAFQEGGIVRGSTGIDQTVARLTAGEFVMPAAQTAGHIEELESMRQGDGEGDGQAINIVPAPVNLSLDGLQVATALIPFLTEESDRGRMRINPRAMRTE